MSDRNHSDPQHEQRPIEKLVSHGMSCGDSPLQHLRVGRVSGSSRVAHLASQGPRGTHTRRSPQSLAISRHSNHHIDEAKHEEHRLILQKVVQILILYSTIHSHLDRFRVTPGCITPGARPASCVTLWLLKPLLDPRSKTAMTRSTSPTSLLGESWDRNSSGRRLFPS